jgi:hypothetical protein
VSVTASAGLTHVVSMVHLELNTPSTSKNPAHKAGFFSLWWCIR